MAVGDRVVAGELLAIANDEPFKIKVQSAEADLNKSKANHDNSAGDSERKKGLRDKNYVSASDLDQALAERDAARNQVAMEQEACLCRLAEYCEQIDLPKTGEPHTAALREALTQAVR